MWSGDKGTDQMRRSVLVALALLSLMVSASALGAATGWKFVASANDSSDFLASASITKKVKNARAARVYVAASRAVTVRGDVLCSRLSDFSIESRTFARTLRSGYRAIPVPLQRAECTYILDATLQSGGTVRLRLAILT